MTADNSTHVSGDAPDPTDVVISENQTPLPPMTATKPRLSRSASVIVATYPVCGG